MKNELVYSTSEAKNCPKLTRRNLFVWPGVLVVSIICVFAISYFLRDYPIHIGLIVFEYIVVGSMTICGGWLICRAFVYWLHKMLWK